MDWNHVNTLLSVIHQAAAAGPKFSGIVAQASDELLAYVADPTPAEAPVEDEEEA